MSAPKPPRGWRKLRKGTLVKQNDCTFAFGIMHPVLVLVGLPVKSLPVFRRIKPAARTKQDGRRAKR